MAVAVHGWNVSKVRNLHLRIIFKCNKMFINTSVLVQYGLSCYNKETSQYSESKGQQAGFYLSIHSSSCLKVCITARDKAATFTMTKSIICTDCSAHVPTGVVHSSNSHKCVGRKMKKSSSPTAQPKVAGITYTHFPWSELSHMTTSSFKRGWKCSLLLSDPCTYLKPSSTYKGRRGYIVVIIIIKLHKQVMKLV